MIPPIGLLRNRAVKSMGTNVAKAWVVLRTSSPMITVWSAAPVSLTAYLRRTRGRLKTRLHRRRRAVF